MNPLKQAIKSGIKANEMIGDLFADIGNKENPRGYVEAAYRNAKRGMVTALAERNRLAAARDVLAQLRNTLISDSRVLFTSAQEAGAEESAKQMRLYGINSPDAAFAPMNLSAQSQSALDVIGARVDVQSAAIVAMIVTNQEDAAILGDESRVGILRPSDIALAAAFWSTALVWDAFDYQTQTYSGNTYFQKQAVAALDSRTTDCCLRVHAQVQPLDSPFRLTGDPRFADEIDWPAFHWYCRTSGVLYLPSYDDGLTTRMRDGADYFLSERAKGNFPDNDPANAF